MFLFAMCGLSIIHGVIALGINLILKVCNLLIASGGPRNLKPGIQRFKSLNNLVLQSFSMLYIIDKIT
jgi:hypothetical protein